MTTLFMTGATGFAGRAVVDHVLQTTDWRIISFQRGDLQAFSDERTTEVFWNFGIPFYGSIPPYDKSGDVFFLHLGAEVHALRSLEDPESFVETNVVGTVNALDLARELEVGLFAYVSTGEVFGGRDEGQSNEDDPLRPSNPYAATKAAGELLVSSYHRSFGLPTIIVRTMNIFSMDQEDPSKFVPIVRNAIEKDQVLRIHAKDGQPGVRQWLHVTAFANQLVDLLRKGMIGKSYHIVGEELTSLEMAQRVAAEMGKPLKYELVRMPKTHEHRYALAVNR
jgi:dTDP-glucose 4,6-dehydratase